MAIDLKKLIVEKFLHLCETKPLAKITVKDIQEETGISRQAFYNHFRDKNDLITYIYQNHIIPKFVIGTTELQYYNWTLEAFKLFQEYQPFMKQACMETGPNCLRDFMTEYCIRFDLAWYKKNCRDDVSHEELAFASKYTAIASISMAINWIMDDMPSSPEKIVKQLTALRHKTMGDFLKASAVE